MKGIIESNDCGEMFIVSDGAFDLSELGPLEEARFMDDGDSMVIYWLPDNIILGYN